MQGLLICQRLKDRILLLKSGIIAAETICEFLSDNKALSNYEIKFKNSWIFKELYTARNVKPSFDWGLILAIIFSGIDQILFRGTPSFYS